MDHPHNPDEPTQQIPALNQTGNRSRGRTAATVTGLVAAGALVGGITINAISASAGDNQGSGNASGTPTSQQGTAPNGLLKALGTQRELTAADAAKALAAAEAKVPSGTAVGVQTAPGSSGYLVEMTKSGTLITVTLDKSFTVTSTKTGMAGGPRLGGMGGGNAWHTPAGNSPEQPAG
jgi:hypothetical protein